jgi:hypothetical protein
MNKALWIPKHVGPGPLNYGLSLSPVSRIDRTAGVTYDRANGRVEQLLPSHDFRWQGRLTPIHGQSLEENLGLCFDDLFRVYRSDGLEAAACYTEAICGVFWRQRYRRDFPFFELARNTPKKTKDLFNLEAATWFAALECLKALNERRGGWQFDAPYTNIGIALGMLIFEGGILNWSIDRFQENLDLGSSVKGFRDRQQSISKKLSEGRSPFPEDIFTHSFVLACTGQEDYPLLEDSWEKLLKARSRLFQHWQKIAPTTMSPASGKALNPRAATARKKQIATNAAKNTRKDRSNI